MPSDGLDVNANTVVVHDVPVLIIPIEDWPEYTLPNVPKFNVSLN